MANYRGQRENIVSLFNKLHLFDRLDDVFTAYSNIDEKLRDEINALATGDASDRELWTTYCYLERRIGNVARQAMLAMVLSWLEASLDLIADDRAVDGSARIPEPRKANWFLRLLRRARKEASAAKGGSEFRKRVNLLRGGGISFDEVEDKCERIDELVIIRNCCIHAAGLLGR